jgi:glucan phosphoethanolaminetransferase (alkaline phosphatase superfamily)
VYGRRLNRYREDVIAYQCHTQKSFSKHNAAVFLLLGIVYMLLDHFLWREFQIGTVFYFIVSLFSAINYLLYQKFLPQHEKWVIPAGCLYIFIMGKFLLSLNLFGGNAMSWTLLLCSLISTSIILIIPAYYAAVMLVVVVMDMVEYAVVNPDMVHIFYNLIDDFVIITFCVGINVIFSKLKYEELDYKEHLFCESSRDPLTMLYNRRYLERYFTERSDVHKTSAFIMLDLDNFKNANDSYGHKKGDEVLCQVSRILRDHFR